MEQAGRGLGGWRQAILITGLISILMVALPAQASLGDLLDDLLDPIEDVPVVEPIVEPIVGPIVESVVDPIVEDIVEPVAGDLVDPVVDEVLAPVLDNVVAPVIETIPTVGTTTNTTLPATAPHQEAAAGDSSGFGVSPSGYPGGVLLPDSNNAGEALLVQSTTDLGNLEAARALQSTLIDSGVTEPSIEVAQPTAMEIIDAGWLNGLTNWLRTSADGLLNLLAMPIRLLELLARALLTAGSGLIAPLSMLLAFTAVLIKDRRWGRAKAT